LLCNAERVSGVPFRYVVTDRNTAQAFEA